MADSAFKEYFKSLSLNDFDREQLILLLEANFENFLLTERMYFFKSSIAKFGSIGITHLSRIFGVSSSTVYLWRYPNTINIKFALRVARCIVDTIKESRC